MHPNDPANPEDVLDPEGERPLTDQECAEYARLCSACFYAVISGVAREIEVRVDGRVMASYRRPWS